MEPTSFILLLICIFIVAVLYSSVGHGGASGYLAAMALFAVPVTLMKPTALILNILVSSLSFYGFYRKKYFQWSLFWPFAIGSIPGAFIGSTMPLSDSLYKKILAVCLLIAILRMIIQFKEKEEEIISFKMIYAIGIGLMIGLLSGMIGIGGGIILSPVLLLLGWANLPTTASISALFIACNSISGLFGLITKGYVPEPLSWIFVGIAFAGGILGSWLGSSVYSHRWMSISLAVGLFLASLKLFFV